jgi:hypothetical protein
VECPSRKRLVGLGVVVAFVLAFPGSAAAKSCDPIKNPYDGTRYEGIDLTNIEAKHVSCPNARRIVRKAHRKGLGLAPNAEGYLYFRSEGWRVKGNLRPSSDRYRATRDDKRVRWRF